MGLTFYNVGSWFIFTVTQENVVSATLTGANGETLVGKVKVSMDENNRPKIDEVTEGSTVVTMTPEGDSFEIGEYYCMVILPGTFDDGVVLTLTKSDGSRAECAVKRSDGNPMVIERSKWARKKNADQGLEYSAVVEDLSTQATANSYIVSHSGQYKFNCKVQGNSNERVSGNPVSADVLWESFNTSTVPNVGDVITDVYYEDGYIYFSTPASFHEGNAVIALKNSANTILWSWHIWATKADIESLAQTYPNGVGEMMDRNLGALTNEHTSDARSYGLYYQWGRKDPFIARNTNTGSTGSWPLSESAQSVGGYQDNGAKSITYSIQNPTTFISWNGYNYDWCYGFNPLENYDKTRWGTEKTKYDPCPPGWRVPDGGVDGFWVVSGIDQFKPTSFSENGGLLIQAGDMAGNDIYYPAGGYLNYSSGSVYNIETSCNLWASTGCNVSANSFEANSYSVYGNDGAWRSDGYNVRCVREDSHHATERPSDHEATNMSSSDYTVLGYSGGKANCYVVFATTPKRYYSFYTYKGNSSTMLEGISSAEVMWESSGTDEVIGPGTLIKDVSYYKNMISFEVPYPAHTGNALIAARDSEGTILWSWHIWITDGLSYSYYPNNAGVVMNQNIGSIANNAGLVYQWGRKDPFLNSYHYNYDDDDDYYITSTITWPSSVSSSVGGSVEYSIAHPTTFISGNNYASDWLISEDNTLWSSQKTIYDPCPAGWHVPDGGPDGLWARAGFPASVNESLSSNMETYFAGTSYPPTSGNLDNKYATYWSSTTYSGNIAYCFGYSAIWDDDDGYRVDASSQSLAYKKAAGAVRCVR